jgi:DNA-directed RNA polymerase subunit RPC12/RpoP
MTERNNENRLGAPPPAQPSQHSPTQHMPQPNLEEKSNTLKFSVPTEFVDLPSRGKYYPQGHPLHQKDSVEIKFLTAKEEDILSSATLIKRGIVFDRLLQSIMVDNINPDDLLIGDKNALLVAARITGYGTEYDTEVRCPSCSSKGRFVFDLSETSATMRSDQELSAFPSVEETANGTFNISLPRVNATVEVKPMNGHDEKRLSYVFNAKSKNNFAESVVTDTLKAYIVSVNGDTSHATINEFVDALPASESRRIRILYKNIMPKVSIESHYSCAKCGHEQELEVPINTDFFWLNE